MNTAKPSTATVAQMMIVTPRQPYRSETNEVRKEPREELRLLVREASQGLTNSPRSEWWETHQLGLRALETQSYDDTRQETVLLLVRSRSRLVQLRTQAVRYL